eukprot:Pompholyxophrys_punicea_v1_NODE_1020_length_1037_cov_1.418534.p2 type:complete len:114 gc:universal NODE_1020_length_1037_cov_1.418534:122-463(+)
MLSKMVAKAKLTLEGFGAHVTLPHVIKRGLVLFELGLAIKCDFTRKTNAFQFAQMINVQTLGCEWCRTPSAVDWLVALHVRFQKRDCFVANRTCATLLALCFFGEFFGSQSIV